MEKEKAHSPTKTFSSIERGDVIIMGLKGLYVVDGKETVDFGGSPQECFRLKSIISETIHSTYLPNNKTLTLKARLPIAPITEETFEKGVRQLTTDPEDFSINSNTKMISYEKRIAAKGFWELVATYFCVDEDVKSTGRKDKRYLAFQERIKSLVIHELRYSNNLDEQTVHDWFVNAERLRTPQ